jgi:hypothetical protein
MKRLHSVIKNMSCFNLKKFMSIKNILLFLHAKAYCYSLNIVRTEKLGYVKIKKRITLRDTVFFDISRLQVYYGRKFTTF